MTKRLQDRFKELLLGVNSSDTLEESDKPRRKKVEKKRRKREDVTPSLMAGGENCQSV